jgi:hypothetical protein
MLQLRFTAAQLIYAFKCQVEQFFCPQRPYSPLQWKKCELTNYLKYGIAHVHQHNISLQVSEGNKGGHTG